MPPKPIRMYIYQPVYTVDSKGKNKGYLNTKTWNTMTYFPVKKGDLFTTEKRVEDITEMKNQAASKVVKVSYNQKYNTCNVILADKLVERKEEPKR